jgi:hypothetical protein
MRFIYSVFMTSCLFPVAVNTCPVRYRSYQDLILYVQNCKKDIQELRTNFFNIFICRQIDFAIALLPLTYMCVCVHIIPFYLIILIYIQQDATLHSLLYLETALHVFGGTSTYHQQRIQLYLLHLVFVTPLLLSAAIVEELELVWMCCGWRTPVADSNNGVTNTRCCRYSCLRSW